MRTATRALVALCLLGTPFVWPNTLTSAADEYGTCAKGTKGNPINNTMCNYYSKCITDTTSCQKGPYTCPQGDCDPTPCPAFVYTGAKLAGACYVKNPQYDGYGWITFTCTYCEVICAEGWMYNKSAKDPGTDVLQCYNQRCSFVQRFSNKCVN